MVRTGASAKRIHLTRHAQAEHNVDNDYTIADAPLTELGKKQARELHSISKNGVQRTADLLVCSPVRCVTGQHPLSISLLLAVLLADLARCALADHIAYSVQLRRPMETMLLGYPALKSKLEKEDKPVILLDTLQEVGEYPCDTPTHPISALKSSNAGIFASLDFSTLSPQYASKRGIYHPDRAAERARHVRRWLRDRPEAEIVVVAHGDILRYIADGENSARPWANAETKVFTFYSTDDDNAGLVEIGHAEPRDATDEPTSSEM